ncbi:MAG: hypothetical protein ACFFG0_02280 [Candidatus Thorarchaeota archaeon]
MIEFEVEKIESTIERDILTGLIVSKDFLFKISPKVDKYSFSQKFSQLLAGWCIEYYLKYGKAPGKDITSLIESKKTSLIDQATISMIETFLQNANERYKEFGFNVEYNIDRAIEFFRKSNLNKLIEKIRGCTLSNDLEKADHLIANYRKVEKQYNTGIDVWSDISANIMALRSEEEQNRILSFGGGLGKLIRPFRRKDFIAFVGPGKRGKSFWLIELAIMASLNGLNVIFISLEMTEAEILLRIQQRVMGMLEPDERGNDIEIFEIPYFDQRDEVYTRKEKIKRLNPEDVANKFKAMESFVGSKFKVFYYPAESIKASDIKILIDNERDYNGFVPDVLLVDYPDILAPEYVTETRHQIDKTWKILRSISQEYNLLEGVVSHTKTATFNRDIRQDDLSEDYRKLNHVTWAGAINQSEDDKDMGIMRLSIIADRFKRFNTNREAIITQCLDIGAVHLDSRIVNKF